MVTDTYAHGFDADRKVIAHEMDTGFFAKVGCEAKPKTPDDEILSKIKNYLRQNPSILQSILNENCGGGTE